MRPDNSLKLTPGWRIGWGAWPAGLSASAGQLSSKPLGIQNQHGRLTTRKADDSPLKPDSGQRNAFFSTRIRFSGLVFVSHSWYTTAWNGGVHEQVSHDSGTS